jgi:valyl-tRNA synthetase
MADTKQTTPPPAPEIIPTLTDVAVAGDLLGEDLPEFAAPPLPAGETPTQAAEPPVEAPSPPTPPPADKPVEIESLIAATVRKELQSTLESTVSRLNDRIRQLEAIIPRTLESSETEKTTSPPPDMGPSKQQPDPQPEPQTLEPAPLDKTYDPHTIELAWYQWWEEHGCFAPSGTGKAFCIMIPPPNVTGTLHMGHAFQDTLMDILIRYHRMQGDNTLWQVGTDHAGIATQMVVERQLAREGRSRRDLGREDFIQKVWEWRESSGGTITRQLRRMGTSVDWSRERFTLDEVLSEAVTEVFVRLYSEGLIYRGKRLVNWDPQLQTAVSDLEVISEEEDGHLWHIRYDLVGQEGFLTVATTRPETMLGDVAVAVHPDDPRFRELIGRQVWLPLTGRTIPIIADEHVDPEFGTGCVKVTPAHDFNDYAIGQRHDLPMINIFTPDAHINDNGPERYRGLERYAARRRVLEDLESFGLLKKTEKHKLMVPRGDRTHAVIEPYLTDQWFVKVDALAAPAIKAVEDGRIQFVPDNWSRVYFEWMRNIQDWCISRQIWWGHRIPAWYDNEGNCFVARDETGARALARERLGRDVPLTQETDVLDTWFSSALWPFSTLGWPRATPELADFYPTSVLVTGFDIIFFWVARMIMMGIKFAGDVPFRQVYIHGLVRDADGHKMSKTKGNVLDPLDLIDGIDLESLVAKNTGGLMQPDMARRIEANTRRQYPNGIPSYGTDALRFTFASLASTGRDIRFDLGRIEGYRNYCNKLWNAARYVLLNTEGHDTGLENDPVELSLPDRWILSRLQLVTRQVAEAIHQYRFDLAAQAVYEFTWNEYCDWYLELSKPVLLSTDSSAAAQRGTRRTLVQVLEALLRLAHPFIPFITEEIWQRVATLAGARGTTIMRQPYPDADKGLIDTAAMKEMEWIMAFVLGIRKIRSGMNIAPGKRLPLIVQGGSDQDYVWYERNRVSLMTLARLEDIIELDEDTPTPDAATALVGDMKLLIPLAGLIDKEAETVRLEKEIDSIQRDLERSDKKLANPSFVERAPVEVVEKERQRIAEARTSLDKLRTQLDRIRDL